MPADIFREAFNLLTELEGSPVEKIDAVLSAIKGDTADLASLPLGEVESAAETTLDLSIKGEQVDAKVRRVSMLRRLHGGNGELLRQRCLDSSEISMLES